jgi:hypothetical protein
LQARCRPVASQVLGRCLRILFVFSWCSLRILLLFSPGAAHLTPWRPHWSPGVSSEPMSSFDSTGSAAIQMKSHFRINRLPLAVRLPRPALPGLATPYAAGQARRFRVDQICFPFVPHRSRICRCSLTLSFPRRDYRSVRCPNPGNSQLEFAYSDGVGSQPFRMLGRTRCPGTTTACKPSANSTAALVLCGWRDRKPGFALRVDDMQSPGNDG